MDRVHSGAKNAVIPGELVARLEVAEAGGRELDAHVDVAARLAEASRTDLAREHWAKWSVSRDFWVEDPHTAYEPGRHTQSLDAALALAERVLGDDLRAIMLLSEIIDGCDHNSDLSISDLPRLLCIAVLKDTPASSVGMSEANEHKTADKIGEGG